VSPILPKPVSAGAAAIGVIPGLNKPFGILARLKKPLDFAAIDGQPIDLIFLLLLPSSLGGEQLNALATVARQLRKPAVTQALRRARDNLEAYGSLTESNER